MWTFVDTDQTRGISGAGYWENTSLDDQYKHESFTIYSLHDTHSKTIPGHFKFGHFQDGRQETKWPPSLKVVHVVN